MNPSKKSEKSKIKNQNSNNGLNNWIGIIAILILGFIIYSNTFNCAFQFDDKHNIVDFDGIRDLGNLKPMWEVNHSRFLSFLSFAINYHYGQLNVGGYHFVNLCIHLLNACLVFWIIRLLFTTPALKNNNVAIHKSSIALVGALMFVSHPLATGAVTYIVQRMASMVATFYFLSIALYLKGRMEEGKAKYKYFVGVGLAALCAIHTKENAYTLPGAIALLEIYFLSDKSIKINFKDNRIIGGLLAVIGVVVIVLTTFSFKIFDPLPPSIYNTETITSSNYFFTQLSVIVKYIQLLILPINQNFDYDFPISNSLFNSSTLLGGLILISLLSFGIYLYNKNRILSFGILWFFLTLSIESSIIPINDVIFEHRTYLPSFGFVFILSTLIYTYAWNKNKNLALALVFLIIGSNTVLAVKRNRVWKDEISLWSDVITKSPNKERGYINRGFAYGSLQQWDKAIPDFNKVNELRPNYHAAAYYNLGIAYWAVGQRDKSMENYSKAIEVDRKYADAYYGRGVCYYYLNEVDKALADYSKAIELKPRPELYYNRGMVYANKQMWQLAINDYSQAISMTPGNADLYFNRGTAYGSMNEWEKAAADFSKTLELNPQNKSATSNLEFAKSKLKSGS